MGKGKTGHCHICGYFTKLTFEHVPPRAAFNDRRILYREIFEIINKNPAEISGGKVSQKGAGSYTLCTRCNNNTGSWYGQSFVEWAYQGMNVLHYAKNRPTLYYNFFLFPLRVIKQIVCMFFSVNAPSFREQNPYLESFVLNRDIKYLPSNIRIYIFYNPSHHMRSSAVACSFEFSSGYKLFSELTYPPFGYVMSFDSKPPHRDMVDITHFASYEFNAWTDIPLKLPVLSVVSYLPGDYRSKAKIEDVWNANQQKKRANDQKI